MPAALTAPRDGAPVAADEPIGLQIRAPRGSYDLFIAPGPGTYQIGGRQVGGGQILIVLSDGTSEQAPLA